MNVLPFAQRLAIARRLIASGGSHLSEHVQDQLKTAANECRDQLHQVSFAVTVTEPERGWRQRSSDGDTEQRALLIAAVLDCMPARCPHLRRDTSPQPTYARLPLRRIDCRRCVGVYRRPPAEDSDRCDVCGARGVDYFVPFAVALGPTLISGDACSSCAGVLGISEVAA